MRTRGLRAAVLIGMSVLLAASIAGAEGPKDPAFQMKPGANPSKVYRFKSGKTLTLKQALDRANKWQAAANARGCSIRRGGKFSRKCPMAPAFTSLVKAQEVKYIDLVKLITPDQASAIAALLKVANDAKAAETGKVGAPQTKPLDTHWSQEFGDRSKVAVRANFDLAPSFTALGGKGGMISYKGTLASTVWLFGKEVSNVTLEVKTFAGSTGAGSSHVVGGKALIDGVEKWFADSDESKAGDVKMRIKTLTGDVPVVVTNENEEKPIPVSIVAFDDGDPTEDDTYTVNADVKVRVKLSFQGEVKTTANQAGGAILINLHPKLDLTLIGGSGESDYMDSANVHSTLKLIEGLEFDVHAAAALGVENKKAQAVTEVVNVQLLQGQALSGKLWSTAFDRGFWFFMGCDSCETDFEVTTYEGAGIKFGPGHTLAKGQRTNPFVYK